MSYPRLRLLVVTSCTGKKRFHPDHPLELEDFRNPDRRLARLLELAEYKCAAGQMYAGLQHLRVMEGVSILRKALGNECVDVAILSAGYGLISEHQEIIPYEVTFNTFRQSREVDEWANFLEIHERFEKKIASYELVFVLLGNKYLRSLSLPVTTRENQTVIFLASKSSASAIPILAARTFIMPLTLAEAKRYSYGLVGLKGFLLKQFAWGASQNPDAIAKVYRKPECFEQVINAISKLKTSRSA
ncbi:MAG: hypothetical protein SW833_25120 [Cyanobacteriota bacterium]|nr:hypothetical protein [Cyanobacteriota bacterium]